LFGYPREFFTTTPAGCKVRQIPDNGQIRASRAARRGRRRVGAARNRAGIQPPPRFCRNLRESGWYISNEGRGIVVADVDGSGDRSIFIVGVATKSGEGRQSRRGDTERTD